jgi:hypothetical protein
MPDHVKRQREAFPRTCKALCRTAVTASSSSCKAHAAGSAVEGAVTGAATAALSSSSFCAFIFNQLKYVCHPMAITPANTLLYCGATNVKLNAVTAGHNFQLFLQLTGTVSITLCFVCASVCPDSRLCIPKKYVLKHGVKKVWLTTIFVAIDTACDL